MIHTKTYQSINPIFTNIIWSCLLIVARDSTSPGFVLCGPIYLKSPVLAHPLGWSSELFLF